MRVADRDWIACRAVKSLEQKVHAREERRIKTGRPLSATGSRVPPPQRGRAGRGKGSPTRTPSPRWLKLSTVQATAPASRAKTSHRPRLRFMGAASRRSPGGQGLLVGRLHLLVPHGPWPVDPGDAVGIDKPALGDPSQAVGARHPAVPIPGDGEGEAEGLHEGPGVVL